MDLEAKLQELKHMHEQGLITPKVYDEQQKALLNQVMGAVTPHDQPAPVVTPTTSSSVWKWLFLIVLVVAGGIWWASKFGSRETRDTVNLLASETGIGTQVIPWADRAETSARLIVEGNSEILAKAIVGITHFTGTKPFLSKTTISKLDDKIVVEMNITWKGGFLGTSNETLVVWEIAKANHVSARILSDTAVTPVSAASKQQLDDYFRTKAYPAFYRGVSSR